VNDELEIIQHETLVIILRYDTVQEREDGRGT
jgi:hypothetical protein